MNDWMLQGASATGGAGRRAARNSFLTAHKSYSQEANISYIEFILLLLHFYQSCAKFVNENPKSCPCLVQENLKRQKSSYLANSPTYQNGEIERYLHPPAPRFPMAALTILS